MRENSFDLPSDYDYFQNKRNDRTYISGSFSSSDISGFEEPRSMRILSKVFDEKEPCEFVQIRKEVVIRTSPSNRQEVKIVFYEDNRKIKQIIIQRFTIKSGKPHNNSFSFSGKEIETLYNIINLIKYIDLEGNEKVRLDDKMMNEWLISEAEKRKYILRNPDLVKEISENHITTSDIVAFAYRKKQLALFDSLLHNEKSFESQKNKWHVRGDEAVWQRFFEENPWIFGYGLNYIFSTQLDNKKLEQVTTGFSFHESGKRVDALMKTHGLISSLCFVEIKTHKSSLLRKNPYRSECWSIDDELSGSIAQIQKTVQKALCSISSKLELTSNDGNPTGEQVFLYQPKAYVVIGSLEEFLTPNGINEQKFSSFELFRRNINNPEIITFDELFARANFIVKLSEEESLRKSPDDVAIISDDFPEEEPF